MNAMKRAWHGLETTEDAETMLNLYLQGWVIESVVNCEEKDNTLSLTRIVCDNNIIKVVRL